MSGGPQVQVAQGELLGRVSVTPAGNNYFSFQGIPYAKPPVGTLRFKAPQSPTNWSGVRDAILPGSPCAQMDPYRPKALKGNEDCLYLNVHTPKLPSNNSEKLPVIVFIHGGRFQAGYGSYYQPDYFIDKNVILVTINYRLNMLGFLALGIPECPGNAGLKDVAFAIRWVNQNIEHFGGDPNNVTAFGESAGSAIACSLLTSPMSKGLVQKLIAESGTFFHDVFFREEDTVEKASNAAKMLEKDIKDPIELLEYFQSLPIDQILELNWNIMRKQDDMRSYFSPVIEPVFEGIDCFFPEDPIKAIDEGRYQKVPTVIGYHSHEAAMFLVRDKKGNIIYKNIEYFVPKYLKLDPNSEKFKRFCEELKQFYFGSKPINDETLLVQYVNLFSDNLFLVDQYRYLDGLVKHQDDVWLFRFSYMGSLNAPFPLKNIRGAAHSDVLPYHFYRKGKKYQNLTQDDTNIVEFFSKSWANFARFGNPQSSISEVGWLPITKDKHYCLNVDKPITLIEYPEKQRMEFWKYLCEKYCNSKSKL